MGDGQIVSLVAASSSPSAACEMIFGETKDVSKAKAGRWLAVSRRDHPTKYHQLISDHTIHTLDCTAQPEEDTK